MGTSAHDDLSVWTSSVLTNVVMTIGNGVVSEITDAISIPRRLFRKAVQQGRSEVRDAKNNERHVCGRARVGESPVSSRRSVTVLTRPPTDCGNSRFPGPYVEPISDATCLREALRRRQGTPLADFVNSLLAKE
jgi:hypothetical protein